MKKGINVIHKKAVNYLIQKDNVFRQIIDQYGLPPDWSRPEGFETLCRIILEQQVSLESGKAAYEKLYKLAGTFTPAAIKNLRIEDMREATVSRQKASYILGIAALIINKELNLEQLSKISDGAAKEILTSIRGIGPWTADVYLLFALSAPDIYPKGDIALINTIKELWLVRSAEEAMRQAEQWSPYRSTACFLLWHYYLSKRGRTSPG